MQTHKIFGASYLDSKNRRKKGIVILNRRTNTYLLISKDLKKVEEPVKDIVWHEQSIGCVYFDLD